MTIETATAAIDLVKKHVNNGAVMQSSAALCLSDAVILRANECYGASVSNAVRSLAYSVGKFHPDYREAVAL